MVAPEQLSRVVSHASRHEPWVYELELDDEGWVPVDALLTAVHEQGSWWADVDREALRTMIEGSAKRRHELAGDRIRALYGHSVPGRVLKIEAEPPARLFLGTSPRAWETIQHDGLRPMARQYVHLSTDVATAEQVGRRKAPTPVILVVEARLARESGTRFWQGNKLVWLADQVPANYVATA